MAAGLLGASESATERRGATGSGERADGGSGRGGVGAAEAVLGMRAAMASITSSTAVPSGGSAKRTAGGCGGGDAAAGRGAAAEVEVSEVVAVDEADRKRRALQPARTSIRIGALILCVRHSLKQATVF